MKMAHYTIRILRKFRLLKHLNVEVKSHYAGKQYVIPVLNGIGFNNLHYQTEPWMKTLINKLLLMKAGVFVDVGANIGQTLMKLRSISEVQYIGMEPNPECVVYLEHLIKANRISGCTICPVGLSNNNGLLTLYSNFAGSPYASVIANFRDHKKWNLNQTHLVPVFRGDHIVNTMFPGADISVLKIDVEGGELEVLEGFRDVLSTKRPFIISEIMPARALDNEIGRMRKDRQNRLFELLKAQRYQVFRILGSGSFERVADIQVNANINLSNYVLVPEELVSGFLHTNKPQLEHMM
jgi:FkbM family methyltransferase